MKSSERRTLDIFLASYDYQMTFKQVLEELTAFDYHNHDSARVWYPLIDVNSFDLITLICEVEEAIRDAIEGEKGA